MSMSVNIHTQTAEKFYVETKLAKYDLPWNQDQYAVIKVTARPEGSYDHQEVSIFPSFEQAKQLHKELSKLMKEIAALDKRTKAEIHAKNITNSKAQKFSQITCDIETIDDLPF